MYFSLTKFQSISIIFLIHLQNSQTNFRPFSANVLKLIKILLFFQKQNHCSQFVQKTNNQKKILCVFTGKTWSGFTLRLGQRLRTSKQHTHRRCRFERQSKSALFVALGVSRPRLFSFLPFHIDRSSWASVLQQSFFWTK